ncbi:MAG: response regulator transcription factor [Thermodesulfobacteriota bacterium]|nr:response regulator transcription factor [Thermodesulfobacteriota bacterium]
MRVLVIEDSQDVAANIGDYLEQKGHVVDFAMDGIIGLHLAVTQPVDVIVLDIMLPGMDGMTLCRRFREESEKSTPILMLTAKDTLDDKLQGFDAGADDYLLKPFALQELEARLQVLVRRSKHDASPIIEVGPIRVDRGRRWVTKEGIPVTLNRTCFRILLELMGSAPNVVAREDLEHLLWGDYKPASDVLRSHIYALRKALDAPGEESFIETIVGVGFRMRSG